MIYGYARVSTLSQKEDRQVIELEKNGVSSVFVDKQSGKDFNRQQYNELLVSLQKGDVLFIKSIDRLGRNYKEIQEQWRIITKVKEVDVVVLDMPLLDTRAEKNLLGTFIADLVLQILAFVAENERAFIVQRSREGLELAKARGVRLGRPKRKLPPYFNSVVERWRHSLITNAEAASLTGMPISTFRRHAMKYLNARYGDSNRIAKTEESKE